MRDLGRFLSFGENFKYNKDSQLDSQYCLSFHVVDPTLQISPNKFYVTTLLLHNWTKNNCWVIELFQSKGLNIRCGEFKTTPQIISMKKE